MTHSSFVMEKDVEDGLDFCMEVKQSPAGQVSVGSDEHRDREEWDWFGVISEHPGSLSNIQAQREGGLGDDRGSQTQDDSKAQADAESAENGEKEAEREVKRSDQTEGSREEKMGGAFDVCLWPIEESGGHVRITLEEVDRYYRFSCCCHWLCGRCQVFHRFLSSSLAVYHIMILIFSILHHTGVSLPVPALFMLS